MQRERENVVPYSMGNRITFLYNFSSGKKKKKKGKKKKKTHEHQPLFEDTLHKVVEPR